MRPGIRPSRRAGGILRSSILALLVAARPAVAGEEEPDFGAARIPPALAADAGAVVRLQTTRLVLSSPHKATEQVRRVITVLKQEGRKHGQAVLPYDRFRKIRSFQGRICDARGMTIRELAERDFKDYSAIPGFALYTDYRIRVADPAHDAYPYTVVLEWEVERDGLVDLPPWYPREVEVPVQRAELIVDAPEDLPVRHRVLGPLKDPQVHRQGHRIVTRWQESDLPRLDLEPDGPSWMEQAPSLRLAPTAFEIAGHQGDLSSWAGFGNWYRRLARGRDRLPADAIARVQALCRGTTDPREKARRLYGHLQATTRYVAVELGIGGWQPFDAAYVLEHGYGDCKALVNYAIAMLQAVEVPAYPVLIRAGAGQPDIVPDLPSNQFNHAILLVPLESDSLWLECTSQTMPFGQLGSGNEDRYALMIAAEGGHLVRTPRSRPSDNRQTVNSAIALREDGGGRAEVRVGYTGHRQERVRRVLSQGTPRDREEWLRGEINTPGLRVVRADYGEADDRTAAIACSFELDLPAIASRTGSRLFLRSGLRERWGRIPAEVKRRTQPVDLGPPILDLDTTSYRIPDGFAVEALPPDTCLQTSFARYDRSTVVRERSLEAIRRYEVWERRLPAPEYDRYRAFAAEVARAERSRIVLVRTGEAVNRPQGQGGSP